MISEVHKLSEEKNKVQEESSENLEVCVHDHLCVLCGVWWVWCGV